MTIRRNIQLFLAAAMLVAGFSVYGQKAVELRYKLKAGEQFLNTSNIEQTVQFEAMGQKVSLDQDMTFYLTMRIDSVEKDRIVQNTTFDRIVMDQQIFGMQMNYDSEDSSTFNSPMGAEFATQMNKLIGAGIISVIDERGKVLKIDASGLGGGGDVSSSLNTGNNYAVYPEGKVKVGDSWTEALTPLETSNMAVTMTYTLKKASRKEAVLSFEGQLSANTLSEETVGELDGTMKGEMTINRKNGMVKSSSIQMDMSMEVEQNGMTFPAKVSSFIDTSVKSK